MDRRIALGLGGRGIEEADPVLEFYVEDKQQTTGLAHERHTLDNTGICH